MILYKTRTYYKHNIIIILFSLALLTGCSKNYNNIHEIFYENGLTKKQTIYWSNENNIDKIVTEYRPSEVSYNARSYYEKPHTKYFKTGKEVLLDNEKYIEQETNIKKTYGNRAKDVLGTSFIYIRNQRVVATKVIYGDKSIDTVVINDEDGRKHKTFIDHGRDGYFDEMIIYDKTGRKIASNAVRVNVRTPFTVLKSIDKANTLIE